MPATAKIYLPFRGLSAWFSASVHTSVSQQWDEYGGTFASEVDAEYLFSDSAFAEDTKRVYSTQKDVCLFLSDWITAVIQQSCSVHDIPAGKYCLQPHYVIQKGPSGNLLVTPTSVPLHQGFANSRGHSEISPDVRRKNTVMARHRAASTSNHVGYAALLGSIGCAAAKDGHEAAKGGCAVAKEGPSSRHPSDRSSQPVGRSVVPTSGPLMESSNLWCNVDEMKNTVKLEDIPHVDELEILNVPFFDFEPKGPGFFLGRVT